MPYILWLLHQMINVNSGSIHYLGLKERVCFTTWHVIHLGMSFSDALTKPTSSSSKSKRPPSVSEIGSRFNAKLLQNKQNEYKLSHVFNPSLEDVQGTFLSVLHKDVITLCSIASIGLENIETSPSASKHTVSFVIVYFCGEVVILCNC